MKSLLFVCIVISFWTNVDAQIQVDKSKHFTTGAVISLITSETLFRVTHKRAKSVIVGIGVGCLAGATKELYDKTSHRGTPDFKDFVWTSVGASAGSITLVFKL